MEERSVIRRCTDKIFGGINFTWPGVIIYAIGTAILTAIFLIVPIFKDTSFAKMGETMEAWVLFAIFIMANCKKPLEAAVKTFVFFLISQPLIYLLQVPFSWQGWGLFQYYYYWFILTILTFPAAFIGWYIKKKNWLSILILSPMLVLLAGTAEGAIESAIKDFPHYIVTAIFCIAQILLYLYVFTEKLSQKLVGILITCAVLAVIAFWPKHLDAVSVQFLPDSPILTEDAVIEVTDANIAGITLSGTGSDSSVQINAHEYGSTTFVIKDQGKTYEYNLEIGKTLEGATQMNITTQK